MKYYVSKMLPFHVTIYIDRPDVFNIIFVTMT
jgi:hypothetical protein